MQRDSKIYVRVDYYAKPKNTPITPSLLKPGACRTVALLVGGGVEPTATVLVPVSVSDNVPPADSGLSVASGVEDPGSGDDVGDEVSSDAIDVHPGS